MNLLKKPYLLFFPFLIISLAVAIIFKTNGNLGDEGTYLNFARNILHGFYSPSPPAIDLRYSPGYPLIIAPFLAFRLPLVFITMLNAIFYYFSIVLLYKILCQFVSLKFTVIVSLFWACYINAYENIRFILSETLTIFLIFSIIFSLVRVFNPGNKPVSIKCLLLSGFLIGYLALTKPIFGYVLLFMLSGSGLLWIIKLRSVNYKKTVIILFIGLATNVPYLLYTYSITGKIFYWSDSGGSNLYWMTTPYEKEYGDWYFGYRTLLRTDSLWPGGLIPGGDESYKLHHKKNMEVIYQLVGVERDDAWKKFAIENIKSHSLKFVQNCISNVGRMLFDFPYSYKVHKPIYLVRFPFNGIIVVMMLFCLIPTLFNWKKVPFSIRLMLVFAMIYFSGSILGSAETRMFTVIVPILLFWIAYILEKSIILKLKFDY